MEYRATGSMYIGELCRYLLNTKETPEEKQHSVNMPYHIIHPVTTSQVRFVIGNGLRPEVWAEFQKRFNVPIVCEFYGELA